MRLRHKSRAYIDSVHIFAWLKNRSSLLGAIYAWDAEFGVGSNTEECITKIIVELTLYFG